MLFQTLIIGFLSFWIYQEYLNNTYLQAYVNGVFAADGWAFATVSVVVLLLGVTTVFLRRNRNVEKMIEVASAGAKASSPVYTGAASKPATTDLHPVVAALKAELAGMPVAMGTPVATGPPIKEEAPSAGSQTALAAVPPPTHVSFVGPRPDTVIVGGMPVLKKEQEKPRDDRTGANPPAQ